MDINAILNHPLFLNPITGAMTAMSLTAIVMALLATAFSEYRLGRQ